MRDAHAYSKKYMSFRCINNNMVTVFVIHISLKYTTHSHNIIGKKFACITSPHTSLPDSTLKRTCALGCSLWSTSMMLGSAESEHPRLTKRENIFGDFQPMCSRYLNVVERTDDLP